MVKNNKKTDSNDDVKDYSFNIDDEIREIEKKIDERISQDKEPEETTIEHIKENMPEPGYMNVELREAAIKGIDNIGEQREEKCISFEVLPTDPDADFMEITYDEEGKPQLKPDGRKAIIFDSIFSMDLHEHAEGQISDCASTVFPQIMDEAVQIALDEKKQRNPEPRKEPYKYWWIWFLVIMLPVIVVTLMMMF